MLRFIDLFAGLGGFHLALKKLKHVCVFASEINTDLNKLYELNFGMQPFGDIWKIPKENIPEHDILCAGFPCQPFSKAGKQEGRFDKIRGNLFDKIVEIIDYHNPEYFILENVPHLRKHDNENTWLGMEDILKNKLKYTVDSHLISPHELGIPQNRPRLFIVGSKSSLNHFKWPEPEKNKGNDIKTILNGSTEQYRVLESERIECIEIWQEFICRIPKKVQIPTFPIWGMEFNADYPYEDFSPFYYSKRKKLGQFKGNFGKPLKGLSIEEKFKNLPSYSRTTEDTFPPWKKNYIKLNRNFFEQYKNELASIMPRIEGLNIQSWQKLEWNCLNGERNIWNYILQFRASGVRVKKSDISPSLVCTKTQVPIIGWEKRYITRNEGAKLQSIKGIELLPNDNSCFRALGNAVNVDIVYSIAKSLIKKEKEQFNTLESKCL